MDAQLHNIELWKNGLVWTRSLSNDILPKPALLKQDLLKSLFVKVRNECPFLQVNVLS